MTRDEIAKMMHADMDVRNAVISTHAYHTGRRLDWHVSQEWELAADWFPKTVTDIRIAVLRKLYELCGGKDNTFIDFNTNDAEKLFFVCLCGDAKSATEDRFANLMSDDYIIGSVDRMALTLKGCEYVEQMTE